MREEGGWAYLTTPADRMEARLGGRKLAFHRSGDRTYGKLLLFLFHSKFPFDPFPVPHNSCWGGTRFHPIGRSDVREAAFFMFLLHSKFPYDLYAVPHNSCRPYGGPSRLGGTVPHPIPYGPVWGRPCGHRRRDVYL